MTKEIVHILSNYLKNVPIDPNMLPINISILFEKNDVIIKNIEINLNGYSDQLFDAVKDYYKNLGN